MDRLRHAAYRIFLLLAVPLTLMVTPELIHTHPDPASSVASPGPLLRPIVTIDHALCLAAAALLAAQQRALGFGPALGVLAASLTVGFAAIHVLPGFALEGFVPIFLALVVGLVVAAAPKVGPAGVTFAVAMAGLWVGFNTYSQDATVSNLAKSLLGLLMGSAFLAGMVAWTALKAQRDWQRIGVRIAGSWIAAIAALILALTAKFMLGT